MDKYEMRRLDLMALRDSLGHGGIAQIARAIGKEPNYVSRMLYEPGKKGRKRIGEDTAELLDQKFPQWKGSGVEWAADAPNRVAQQASLLKPRLDDARFEVLDVQAACGPGALNPDYPEVVTSMSMPMEEAHRLIGTANRNGWVKIILAAKDSMTPTINPNDLLFVDTSVTEYTGETIYILLHGGELVCKRLSLVGKDLMVLSDNQSYPAWKWEDRPDDTRIVGKVLRALPMNFKNFGQG